MHVERRRAVRATTGASSERIIRPTVSMSFWPCSMRREFREVRLQPVLLGVLHRRVLQVADHLVDVVLQRRDFAARLDLDRPRQIAFRHGRRHFGDRAHLRREIRRQLIDVIRQVAPCARGAGHTGLAAELSFDTHFARHRGHLIGKRRQRVDHRVDRVRPVRRFRLWLRPAACASGRRWPPRSRPWQCRAPGSVRLRGHEVHVVGQVLPRARHAFAPPPGRRAFLRCPLRAPRGSLPRRTS